MKTIRYQLEKDIESANASNVDWLKMRFKEVLESDKDFTRKCDYLGLSIASIDDRLQSIDDEIKELRALKDVLKSAKEISLTLGAQIFSDYGISRLEGTRISSITITNPIPSSKLKLTVINDKPLIEAGFYKKVIDTDVLLESYKAGDYVELISQYCTIEMIKESQAKKLKINKRRTTITDLDDTLLEVA